MSSSETAHSLKRKRAREGERPEKVSNATSIPVGRLRQQLLSVGVKGTGSANAAQLNEKLVNYFDELFAKYAASSSDTWSLEDVFSLGAFFRSLDPNDWPPPYAVKFLNLLDSRSMPIEASKDDTVLDLLEKCFEFRKNVLNMPSMQPRTQTEEMPRPVKIQKYMSADELYGKTKSLLNKAVCLWDDADIEIIVEALDGVFNIECKGSSVEGIGGAQDFLFDRLIAFYELRPDVLIRVENTHS